MQRSSAMKLQNVLILCECTTQNKNMVNLLYYPIKNTPN